MVKLYLKKIKKVFVESIFPSFCLGCQSQGEWFCSDCVKKSTFQRATNYCMLCLRYVGVEGRLCRSHARDIGLTGLVSALNYSEESTKNLIYSLKYESVFGAIPEVTEKSFNLLNIFFNKNHFDAIIPIPLSFWRLKERGYNQSELIARSLAKKLGLKIDLNLIKIKETKSQANLPRIERNINLLNAFSYKGILRGKILLVDDVITTGSTMKIAASVIRRAGASEVWGLALAHEPKNKL